MTLLAATRMAKALTAPFGRGADTLALTLVGGDGGQADVQPYSFDEHRARFDAPPEPRYVLTALRDVLVDLLVTVDYTPAGGGSRSVTLTVPAGSLAGDSFVLSLGNDEGPDTRLSRVHLSPSAPAGTVARDWLALSAMLGNMAKLLWVTGWDRDHIARQMELVAGQRQLQSATGQSLDLAGYDLGVPRFPALPYSFDADAVALYHFDDAAGATPAIEDFMGRYPGRTAHHGSIAGSVQLQAVGRFGAAALFADPGAEIQVADHTDFAVAPGTSLTVECFVQPDPATADGHVLAKHGNPNDVTQAGWALSIGSFGRGIPLNARFLVGDGTQQVIVFADVSLATDRFSHLAGVLDRQLGQLRLYVDGRLLASTAAAGLGDLTNNQPLLVGRAAGAAYTGVVDEVRISRTARAAFAPVLGESDDSYRRRLRIFNRWTLPSPDGLTNALNEAVGNIGGDAAPLVLDDADATLLTASQLITVIPQTLDLGESMDSQGNRGVTEANVCGSPADDTTFDPAYLLLHNDPRAEYPTPAARTLDRGELPPDPHKMQAITATALDSLLTVLAAAGIGGKVIVQSAFDPRASDLRAVGRGLVLAHTNAVLNLGRLAALAHQAGFAFVARRSTENAVYVSTPVGERLRTKTAGGTATGAAGFDLFVGQTLMLQLEPALPPQAPCRWLTIDCGAGRARFTTASTQPSVTLQATSPGQVVVKGEVTSGPTVSGTRSLRIGPADLADGQSIGADGTLGVSEDVAAGDDPFFSPAYLVTFDDARVSAPSDLNRRRVHPAVARRLSQLLTFISASGAPGVLQITQAFQPGATGVAGRGRALTINHSNVAAGHLAVLAHAAGFSYVRRNGTDVVIRQGPEDLLALASSGGSTVQEGATVSLGVGPTASPAAVWVGANAIYVANRGTDSVTELDPASGAVRRLFKVGWRPSALTLSPDGARLYTADTSSSTISVIDLAAGTVLQALPLSAQPTALAHSPAQQRLYVVCQNANLLVEIDTGTLAVARTLAVGNGPVAVAVRPNGAEIWVALAGDNRLSIVDATAFTALASVALPDSPSDVAVAPDGGQAYAALPATNRLAIVNVAGRNVVGAPVTLGQHPQHIAVSPDSTSVFVTDSDRLYLTHTNGAVARSMRLSHGAGSLAISGSQAFVTNLAANELSVLSLPGLTLTGRWSIGSGLGERLTWVASQADSSRVELGNVTAPTTSLAAKKAGAVLLRAIYALSDHGPPYAFTVGLKPALRVPSTVVRKDQYDLIMNVLNALHPVGVEVLTGSIRQRVVELRDSPLGSFPEYTYPNFRARAPRPVRPNEE